MYLGNLEQLGLLNSVDEDANKWVFESIICNIRNRLSRAIEVLYIGEGLERRWELKIKSCLVRWHNRLRKIYTYKQLVQISTNEDSKLDWQ